MRYSTIVVIDDDLSIREMIKTLLEIEGYRVLAASNGAEALRLLPHAARPCLVLLDMMMPTMHGWDFLERMREIPGHEEIPVVVVSAYPETARSLGPRAYLPKPIQFEALLEVIEGPAA